MLYAYHDRESMFYLWCPSDVSSIIWYTYFRINNHM